MTAELVDRQRAAGAARVKVIARQIAHSSPALADLSQEQLERLAKVVVGEEMRDNLKKAADLERVDLEDERVKFLARYLSPHTRMAYSSHLARFEEWAKSKGVSILEISPAQADDFINDQIKDGRAPATVRMDATAPSTFFSWLERRHKELRNPFRGTRERPTLRPKRPLEVPTVEEVAAIIAAADGQLRGAIVCMAKLGLRVGALPSFTIKGDRWSATTKGKAQSGPTAETAAAFAEVRMELKRLGLPLRGPFSDISAAQISDNFKYLIKKMKRRGNLSACFSPHDLRHHFAVELYRTTKDIYRVRKALGHASVAVTEGYLKSLQLDVG